MRTAHGQGKYNAGYEMSGGKEAQEEATRIRKRATRDYYRPKREEFPKLHLYYLGHKGSVFLITSKFSFYPAHCFKLFHGNILSVCSKLFTS